MKSVDFDIGTRPEPDDVEYAYHTPSELRIRPGSGKSLLMAAPLLTVRLTGVAKERVVTAPRRVRRVTGNIVMIDEDRGAGDQDEPTDQSGVLIERCLGEGRKAPGS